MIAADETFDGTWPYAPQFFSRSGFRQHFVPDHMGLGKSELPRHVARRAGHDLLGVGHSTSVILLAWDSEPGNDCAVCAGPWLE